MSIINDALKKTQQSRKLDTNKRAMAKEKQSELESNPAALQPLKETMSVVKKMDFLLFKRGGFLTATIMLGMIGYVSYQHAKNPTLPIIQAAATPAKEKMAFTGILVADNTKIAMINKQSYHLGDTVNGMRIVAINQDTIDLRRDDKVIQIRAGATYLL